MSRKGKRTKGSEQAHPFAGLSKVNPHAAGVDIGAEEIVVCVAANESTQLVRGFGNYTVDLHAIADWLSEHEVKTVAMESTGVYWIPLFEVLEGRGFECLLTLAPHASAGVSSRSLRRVSGRKSDITDAQWIQTLHSYGLLESSFRPQADLVGLRSLLRHRRSLIDHRSPHVLHMQKALLQMNIQLSQAVSDVTGVTGQAIMRAILAGVRDPQELAALREPGCKKSEEEIGKALTGTWREEHLFVLKQAERCMISTLSRSRSATKRSSVCTLRPVRIGMGENSNLCLRASVIRTAKTGTTRPRKSVDTLSASAG